MIIKSIEVDGFRGIKGPLKLDFPNGIIGIFGENESGKTTLMDSIFVGLYGLPVGKAKNEKDSKQYQITWGFKKAKIKIHFTVGNENYLIEREMTKTNHKCTLKLLEKSGKENSISSNITEIRNQIVELTGMDRSSFSKLVYIRQKDLDSLSDLQKTDREGMLNKVMGIDIFDKIVRRVKGDKKEVKNDLQSTNIKFEILEDYKAEKKEKDSEFKVTEQEVGKLQKELQKLNKQLKDLKSKQKQLNWLKKEGDTKQKIVKYKDVIAQLEERIKDLENNTIRRNEIKKDLKPLDKIEEECEHIQNLQSYIKDKNLDNKNLQKLQKEIKGFRDENTNFEEFVSENKETFDSLIDVEAQISINKQEIAFLEKKKSEIEPQYMQKEEEVNTALEELETLLEIQNRDQLKHRYEHLNAKEPRLKKRRTITAVIAFTLFINIVLSIFFYIFFNILVWIITATPVFAISLGFSIFYVVKYYNLRKQKRYYSIYEKLDSERKDLENQISELSYNIEKEEKIILE
ncbi:MAG: AAA family ATPase, partial [Candidatus Heimdallarchaeota archaeon]|nr:AAA family ATPase [Candidatus Heimdallarchaeota archaeon]MCK4610460.1 AAA family ATPase [Candidatus Heimdallarchaeota archaeon]